MRSVPISISLLLSLSIILITGSKASSSRLSKTLSELRTEIDSIDQQLVELLNQRFNVSEDIGLAKQQLDVDEEDEDTAVYVPSRELAVFDKVVKLNAQIDGPLSRSGVQNIFREIMSFSISLQRPLTIGFSGSLYGLGHQAARARFGASLSYMHERTLPHLLESVARYECEYAVAPLDACLDALVSAQSTLKIYATITTPRSYTLSSNADTIESLSRVYLTPDARSHCSRWLTRELDGVQLVEVATDVAAAELAAASDTGAGAICTLIAAESVALRSLATAVEDALADTVTFGVIGRQHEASTGKDSTILMFAPSDGSGALFSAIDVFKSHGCNLTRIQSRRALPLASSMPLAGVDYVFFAEVDGHIDDRNVRGAVSELERSCHIVQVLGSFAKNPYITFYGYGHGAAK